MSITVQPKPCFSLPTIKCLCRLKRLRTLSALLLLGLLLGACAQSSQPVQDPGPPVVGDVSLISAVNAPEDDLQLSIGVKVFTPDTGEQDSAQAGAAIFAEIHKLETSYIPVALRSTLVASNQWGVVRVLPEDDPSVDIVISGSIVESDGARLVLQIRAVDSTGRVWLDRLYADETRVADFPDTVPSLRDRMATAEYEDPFQDIYIQIANDLLAARAGLSVEEQRGLIQVSQLLHARDLAPEAFADYVQPDAQGLLTVNRLPAQNDPMLARVAQIRLRHHVFIDTIDEYYEALYQDVKPTYDIWRQYSFEQVLEERQAQERAQENGNGRGGGSFESISQNYNRYKWAKIFEQEFVALASGFVSETAPAVLQLSASVNGLTGPVEQQYAQWRELLRQLFEVETGGSGR